VVKTTKQVHRSLSSFLRKAAVAQAKSILNQYNFSTGQPA